MKTLALPALAVLLWGCAEEPAETADPIDAPAEPAEVVTPPADDAMTDTMTLDDAEIPDEALEAGTTEDVEP